MLGTDVHKLDKPTDTTVEEQLWYEVSKLKAQVHGLKKSNSRLKAEVRKARRQVHQERGKEPKE